MKSRKSYIFVLFLLVVFLGILLTSCGSGASNPSTSAGGSGDGATLLQERCSVCHSTERITSAHKTASEWATTVERMISNGAQLNASEQQTLVDYLAATYK